MALFYHEINYTYLSNRSMMTYASRLRNKFLILIHKDINVFEFPRHTAFSTQMQYFFPILHLFPHLKIT